MFTKKHLFLIPVLSLTMLFGCSDKEVTTTKIIDDVDDANEVVVANPIETITALPYEQAMEKIAVMTLEELGNVTGDVKSERLKMMFAYAEQYPFTEAEAIQFTADIIRDFAMETYLIGLENDEIVLKKAFKSFIASDYSDEMVHDFVTCYYDTVTNVYKNKYASNSENVINNAMEMSKTVQSMSIVLQDVE